MNMTIIISVLSEYLTNTNLSILSQICKSILIASGKITMLEISRTTIKSYRTLQRFYAKKNIGWDKLNVLLFKRCIYKTDDILLFAADEMVEKKAGKHTYGLSYFFSNIFKQTVSSVAFMALSIVSVKNRKSYPLAVEQIVKEKTLNVDEFQDKQKTNEPKPKGRPKNSKNKPKQASKDIQYKVLDALLKSVVGLLISQLGYLPVSYLLLDGYFGNQYYVRLAKQYNLNIISKLKSTSGLYLPYIGIYSGKGRKNKYGKKIDKESISNEYLVKSEIIDGYLYQYYQMKVWNKSITDYQLNVVIIKATQLKGKRTANCILFTSDLDLSYEKIVEYYSLRFQIEFNFRDAKQYFGLADFKNYKQTQVTNAANISFMMCNFSYILINYFKEHFGIENMSILDLKAFYRAEKIGNETLKLKKKAKKADQLLNVDEIFKLAKFQSVNF